MPRVWILLPFKSEHCYRFMFAHLFDALQLQFNITRNNIHWATASIDFESGLIAVFRNYVKLELPGLVVEGCHFHYAQCLHRKLTSQEVGLGVHYNDRDCDLRRIIKMLFALAFLPSDEVAATFQDIILLELRPPFCNDTGQLDDVRLEEFFQYYLNTWLGSAERLAMFNCFHRQDHRTNNYLEGFHNKLQKSMKSSHPNLWKFIDCIKGIIFICIL